MVNHETNILVVDDDERLRHLLAKYLFEKGFKVQTAADTQQARTLLDKHAFSAIVLDIMMPGETGLEFTRYLRQSTRATPEHIPILLLTALGEVDDRIAGLEHGADDYLSKPFEPKELLLRLQTILRRHRPQQSETQLINFGKFSFDPSRGTLFEHGTPVNLTSGEAQLLTILAHQNGQPVSREDLARQEGICLCPRTIDVQVTRLRKKIEDNPRQPLYLKTIRHKGYVLWAD